MGTFIAIFCLIHILAGCALLNSFFYVVNKKWCRRINSIIYRKVPRKMFACLKCYAHFEFKPDYTLAPSFPEQFMIIGNHQSLFDIVVFYLYFPQANIRFVAKNALGGHVPLVSAMLKADGHCLINQNGGPAHMMKTIDAFGKRCIENKWSPVIFPEGTRSKTGKVGTFHAAGFRRLAGNVKLPVIVFALDGGWQIRDILKIIKNLKSGAYYLKPLKLYPAPETKAEQVAILDEGKALIDRQLTEWRRK